MGKSRCYPSTVRVALSLVCVSNASASTDDGAWDASLFIAHPVGVNSISWAPACHPSSLVQPQRTSPSAPAQHVKKFATGGCDSVVKIWNWKEETKEWVEEETLDGHSDWVRDVAWAPNVGLPRTYLASASQVCPSPLHLRNKSWYMLIWNE